MGRVPPGVIRLSIQPGVLSKNDNKVVPYYNVIKYPGPRPRQQVKSKDQQAVELSSKSNSRAPATKHVKMHATHELTTRQQPAQQTFKTTNQESSSTQQQCNVYSVVCLIINLLIIIIMKEKIEELINAAEVFKETLECKPSYISALRGAEDCDDSYQEYLEWTWEYRDTKDTLVSKLKEMLELC